MSRATAAVPSAAQQNAGAVFPQLFGVAYLALVTNLLFVVTTAPFLLAVMAPDALASWPTVALTAPLLAPAVTGAFTAFRGHFLDGADGVLRSFVRGWWRHLGAALRVGAATTALLVVLAVDVVVVWGDRIGALSIPFFAVVAALGILTGVLMLVSLTEGVAPSDTTRRLLVVCATAVLNPRRWWSSLVSLLALGLMVSVVAVQPVIGLGVAVAPLLYVVWAGGRYALQPLSRVAPPPGSLTSSETSVRRRADGRP